MNSQSQAGRHHNHPGLRRLVLFTTFVVATGLSHLVRADTAQQPRRPNVILIMTDDQGYGDFSAHGNPILKAPHLDRLREESIRFTDFHVAPMCTPTRGQLMTGVDALRNGAMNVSSGRTLLRPEFKTMAEIFRSGGYRTGIFGKWHLGDNYPHRPQDRGFEESVWMASSHSPSASDYWNNDYFDDVYWHNGRREPFSGYATDIFFRKAMDWMRLRWEKGEPFFCYLPTNAPHGPLFVPDSYREPYRDQSPPVASFFGMIANIDHNLGILEKFLRETGLRENTILIFLTDNGTATGEKIWNAGMRGKKISLYEGGHRVSFFIRWPGGNLRPPADLDILTQVQDVLPTLLELCGLERPEESKFDGVSLAKVLKGEASNLDDRMLVIQFSRMNDPIPQRGDAAVLWKQWRLVGGNELFDIRRDPGQQSNVIGDHPEIARRMQQHYAEWWEGVAPRLNEFTPIHIGSSNEPLTMLTPCDWNDTFLDQQFQIRRGVRKNGAWTLFVESPGVYEFELRRWPYEADAAIRSGVPAYQAVDGVYPEGQALPVAQARLRIGTHDLTSPVAETAKMVMFRVDLPRGRTKLQTWFLDSSGEELSGAYYVYVRRAGT
ncbi:MAG: arylsulfatase [Acidobacteriota bacterium]